MNEKSFSMKEALVFGWDTVKSNLGFIIALEIAVVAVSFISHMIVGSAGSLFAKFLFLIVTYLFQWFVGMQCIKVSLIYCGGRKPSVNDLFSGAAKFWPFAAATLIYSAACTAGFLLLIVPGIIFSIQFVFYGYIMVDKNIGPVKSITASSAVTKGVRWQLFLFVLLAVAINIAGALCFLVGIFVTMPATFLAAAHIYRRLLSQTELGI